MNQITAIALVALAVLLATSSSKASPGPVNPRTGYPPDPNKPSGQRPTEPAKPKGTTAADYAQAGVTVLDSVFKWVGSWNDEQEKEDLDISGGDDAFLDSDVPGSDISGGDDDFLDR